MGKEFYAKSLSVRKFYDDTEKLLSTKIAKVCFLGPKEDQDKLMNAHLATFVNDIAFFDPLVSNRRKPEVLTGIGVGEVAGLVAAECLPFINALQYVFKRTKLLEAFAEKQGGASISITGIQLEQLQPMLAREEGEVIITHYLAPDTFILWGHKEAIGSLQAETQGIKQIKTNPQQPRGPLFSPLAQELEQPLDELLTECLGDVKLKHPKIPFHACSDGEYVGTPEGVRAVLTKQYSHPVQWVQTVKAVIFRGFRTWVEVGPGRVYSSMVKKIDVDTRITNVEDMKSLSTTVKVTG
jgi:[acyl-carrier-protein] S-malonyltransferase